MKVTGIADTYAEIRRVHRMVFAAAGRGVGDAMDRFKVEFTRDHLQSRSDTSLGPRSRGLLSSFATDVTASRASGAANVTGRAFFDGDDLLQSIARVHVLGTTGKGGLLPPIRPTHDDYLTFQVHRKWWRGSWPFEGTSQWLSVDEVNIEPGRLPIFIKWREFEPIGFVIVDSRINQVLLGVN